MAEELKITRGLSKTEKYQEVLPQIRALLEGENDLVANMANVAAVLRETFGFYWVGFYRNIDSELVLGPFQGPIACTRIQFGKGVCGTVASDGKLLIVPDVEAFPGHIACSSASRSEIVVPGIENKQVKWVLDVDSDKLNDFDEIDAQFLEAIVDLM